MVIISLIFNNILDKGVSVVTEKPTEILVDSTTIRQDPRVLIEQKLNTSGSLSAASDQLPAKSDSISNSNKFTNNTELELKPLAILQKSSLENQNPGERELVNAILTIWIKQFE